MNPKEYEQNVLVTNTKDLAPVKARIDDVMIGLIHAGYGWASELSELVDAINVADDLDYVNISEEIGDLTWYTSVAVSTLGFDPEEISSHEFRAKDAGLLVKDYNDLRTTTESIVWATGEFDDLVKKHLFYGKQFNVQRAKELLQSLCLSMAGMALVCGTTLEQCRSTNITKLKARYGEKFSEAAALNRDLETERKILEDGIK